MAWEELDQKTNARFQSSKPEYDAAREELVPVIEREERSGAKPIEPLDFQPVRSPGIYEGEFAKKSDDLIFHFWPSGYHEAERTGAREPKFSSSFEPQLKRVFEEVFGAHRIEIANDADVGAFSVKAFGWGSSEFFRKLSIEACEKLHYALGGT